MTATARGDPILAELEGWKREALERRAYDAKLEAFLEEHGYGRGFVPRLLRIARTVFRYAIIYCLLVGACVTFFTFYFATIAGSCRQFGFP
jgi:hypothetical protein